MNQETLREALFRSRETVVGLAKRLGVPATTLSSWARNVHPCPAHQRKRVERALKLKAGALAERAGAK